jgi:hypothetical protein
MHTKSRETIVVIPNEQKLEVTFYCSDNQLTEAEKVKYMGLFIQVHDCHFEKKIPKSFAKNNGQVEEIVQKTVINAKGHLC